MNGREVTDENSEITVTLSVTEYHPPQRNGIRQAQPKFTNLYVKNFPTPDYDDAELIVLTPTQLIFCRKLSPHLERSPVPAS